MEISEREKLVLNAIVDYYLTIGETIGSRTLVKKIWNRTLICYNKKCYG